VNCSVNSCVIKHWTKKVNVLLIWIQVSMQGVMKYPRRFTIYFNVELSSENSRMCEVYSIPGLRIVSGDNTPDGVKQKCSKKYQSECKIVHQNSQMVWLETNRCLRGHTTKTNRLRDGNATVGLSWHFLTHRLLFLLHSLAFSVLNQTIYLSIVN
jgi:hypothetical protein